MQNRRGRSSGRKRIGGEKIGGRNRTRDDKIVTEQNRRGKDSRRYRIGEERL